MFEIIMDTLEVLQKDETIVDVLNTVGAATLSLADETLHPVEYYALSFINSEAAKRIKEIIKDKLPDLDTHKPAEQ